MCPPASDHGHLKWLCRRGVRELDLVLEAWLENGYADAPEPQQAAFAELLAMNDPQLFDLLLGRREAPDAAQQTVVEALRRMFRTP